MGSCASVHKTSQPAMKPKPHIESKIDERVSDDESQTEDTPQTVLAVSSFRSTHSKEDMFFDSQPGLESDNEDFFSVNGDFTPSRGTSPLLQSNFLDKSLFMDTTPKSISNSSPTDKKHKLAELLHRNSPDNDNKFLDSGNGKVESAKPTRSAGHCCLTNVVHSLSFREKSKERKSAASDDGKG